MTVALTGKVKFTNTGKTQYKVETLLNGKRSRWQQTFNTTKEALEYIDKEQSAREGLSAEATFLVTEVITRTLGEF